MTPAERFVPVEDAAALRRERTRARELRQSGWWKRRIADGRCHYCARVVGALQARLRVRSAGTLALRW